MRIRDHQLHPTQAAAGHAAQKFHPERFGFVMAGDHPQHLPPAVGSDADGDDHGGRYDAVVGIPRSCQNCISAKRTKQELLGEAQMQPLARNAWQTGLGAIHASWEGSKDTRTRGGS